MSQFLKLKPTSDKLNHVAGRDPLMKNLEDRLYFQRSSYVEIPFKKLSVEYIFYFITNINVVLDYH